MAIQESGEMYLESLLVLSKEKQNVRAIDIVEHMGFSKPAVSRALTKLRADGLILTDSKGHISFTEAGKTIAEKVYGRHVVLTSFIRRLGVDEATAVADACKIEHVISDTTFNALVNHAEKHQ